MFMDTGLSRNEAAKRLGWFRKQSQTQHWKRKDGTYGETTYVKIAGDVTRLGRALGWSPRFNKDGEAEWSRTVHYDTAVHLCTSWGLDPVDYGI